MGKRLSSFLLYLNSLSLAFKIFLLVGFCISLYIAIVGIQNYTIFGYDQSRDAFESYAIWHTHHLKILGPETDIPGVFHGVLWYYILAIPYAIKNIPESAAIFFTILLYSSAIVIGLLSQKLFKNIYISTISFLLYILSPIFEMSTHWLSNPILSLICIPFILLFLWNFLQKPNSFVGFLLGLLFGIFIQGEVAFSVFLICLPIYWFLFKSKISLMYVSAFFLGLGIGICSFIIAEIKFHFQGVKSILLYLHNTGHSHVSIGNVITNLLLRSVDLFSTSVFVLPSIFVLFFLGVACYAVIIRISGENKNPLLFLCTWLGTLLFFQIFNSGISSSYFLFFPYLPVVSILISYLLVTIFKNKTLLFCVFTLLILFQIHLCFIYFSRNSLIFSVQQGATAQYDRKIIDYTYKNADGKPFTIITITNPLYINTTWAYWYRFYGLSHYGYLPYFGGKDQADQLGYLPQKPFGTNIRYLIIEPTQGIPDIYVAKITYEEDKISDILNQVHIGGFIIQKRKFHPHKPLPIIPEILVHSPILYE